MKKTSRLPSVPIRIRSAGTADVAAISRITNSAFAIETFLGGARADEDHVRAMMQRGKFLVAEGGDGSVVASAYLELRGRKGYLGMLAVDPTHQRQGVAHAVIAAGEKYFQQFHCSAVDITVLSLRPELLPFYNDLGYRRTGVEEFRPSRPLKVGLECHGILMSKDL